MAKCSFFCSFTPAMKLYGQGLQITFFLLSVLHWCLCTKVNFNFTSSPTINIGQTALYQCTVNDSRVNIHWLINGHSLSKCNECALGSSPAKLTIPGLPSYNNTIVTCLAVGVLENGEYRKSSNSTLIIQGIILCLEIDKPIMLYIGKLPAVKNLLCEQEALCMQCSWNPPFSLTSISGYAIIISSSGMDLYKNYTTTRSISYCPSQYAYGLYNISIAANNTAELGEVTFTTVNIMPKGTPIIIFKH